MDTKPTNALAMLLGIGRALAVTLLLWTTSTSLGGNRAALVIGNDAYPEDGRLESCVRDARAFAEWLYTIGYERHEIQVITDASTSQMIGGLEDLARRAELERHEQIIIYYSGHGTTVEDDDGDEGASDSTDEALVSVDSPDTANTWEQCLVRDDQLDRFLRRLSAGTDQLILVLDCCFSGGALKGNGGSGTDRAKRISETQLRRWFLKPGQEVPEGEPERPLRIKGVQGVVPHGPLHELKWRGGTGSFLFFSAATEFQTAQAGRKGELSAYTEAFLDLVNRADRGSRRAVRLRELQSALKKRLAGKQTPGLETHGIADSVAVSPHVFSASQQVAVERSGSQILGQLVLLDRSPGDANWTVDAECSQAGPVQVGQRYHLRVRPSHDGYLVVFTVEADGEATFFFPNKHRRDNRVQGGTETSIPWENGLVAAAPAGTESFYVFLLDFNPFQNFNFDTSRSDLLIGQLSDVVRRNPTLGTVERLRSRLERRPATDSEAAGRGWTKSVLHVCTVAREGKTGVSD